MTPEETKRIVDDSVSKMGLPEKPSPERLMVDKLDAITQQVIVEVKQQVLKHPQAYSRERVMRLIAESYMLRFHYLLDKEETQYLLAATLAAHVVDYYL